MNVLNVLIACEESQVECIAFRKLGHNAFSCDIQMCSGGIPEYHIQSDVLPLLNGNCTFTTVNGTKHFIDKWDLIIAHPPCTYLTRAGSQLLFNKSHQIKDFERFEKMKEAAQFFFEFYNLNCPYVCIENPVPMKICNLPQHSQVIQPFQFGHPFSKMTYLWLKGLPPLFYTDIVFNYDSYLKHHGNSKSRSKSFTGIAEAMAAQWSEFILNKTAG